MLWGRLKIFFGPDLGHLRQPTKSKGVAVTAKQFLTIYQKQKTGKLNSYCGAVSAECASAATLCYLNGGELTMIEATIHNTLAVITGMICDGAKITYADKVTSVLRCGIHAYRPTKEGKHYDPLSNVL